MARIRGIAEMRLAERVRTGAVMGSFVAALCVGIGVLRGAVALLGGARLSGLRPEDVAILAAYAGGFVVAGAVLGALAPARRTKAGALLMGFIGAGVVCTAFGAGIAATAPEYRRDSLVFAVVVCTVIFGVGLAKELYEPPSPAA